MELLLGLEETELELLGLEEAELLLEDALELAELEEEEVAPSSSQSAVNATEPLSLRASFVPGW